MTIFDFMPRSDAAVIRNLLHEIEAAQDSGASRHDLWRHLCEHHHLKLSFDAFCVALKRARAKERNKSTAKTGNVYLTAGRSESDIESAEGMPEPKRPHPFSPNASSASGTRELKQNPDNSPRRNRIRTPRDFADVHKLDFNEFDDKFK